MATPTLAQLNAQVVALVARLDAFNTRADAIEKLLAGPLVQKPLHDTAGNVIGLSLVLADPAA